MTRPVQRRYGIHQVTGKVALDGAGPDGLKLTQCYVEGRLTSSPFPFVAIANDINFILERDRGDDCLFSADVLV